MRTRIVLALVLTLALATAGCQASTPDRTVPAASASGTVVEGATPAAPFVRGNSVMGLVMGTFQLDGTDNAVTAEDAAALLPLWKAYRALLDSDSTAPEELSALVEQIRGAMGTARIDAIEAADSTPEDLQALADRFGFEMPVMGGAPNGGAAPEGLTEEQMQQRIEQLQDAVSQGTEGGGRPEFRGQGAGPAGGFAGGAAGGAPPAGAVVMGGDLAGGTPPDGAGVTGGAEGANTMVAGMLDALITYLEGLE